jgi:predicted XRE-type DNA-binding protein
MRNVFEDMGFSSEEAAILAFKSDLYTAIREHAKHYSQKELQIIFGEPQPRVSEILNGKIAGKSIEKLLHYAYRLGLVTKARFFQAHKEIVQRALARGAAAGR